jgi:hypothetical protein
MYISTLNHRITNDEVKSLMRRVFENRGIEKFLESNPRLYTKHNEEISLDFKFKSTDNDYYLKAFSLDYRKKNSASNQAKAWAYNIDKLRENLDDNSVEFKFVINNAQLKSKTEKLIYDILSDVSRPILLKDLDEYIDTLQLEKR